MSIDLLKDIDHEAVGEILNVKPNYGYTLKRTQPDKYKCVALGILCKDVNIDHLVLVLQLLEEVTADIEVDVKKEIAKHRLYNKGRS